MNLLDYTNLGGVIFTVAALVFIIREFLKFVKCQENNFKDTLDNHLKENSQINQNLASAVKELLDYLKHKNGHR